MFPLLPRPYAFTLLVIGSLLIGHTYYLISQLRESPTAEEQTATTSVISSAIALQEQQLEDQTFRTVDRLQQPSKYRYRSTLPFLAQADAFRLQLRAALPTHKVRPFDRQGYASFLALHHSLLDSLATTATELLREEGTDFGYAQEWLTKDSTAVENLVATAALAAPQAEQVSDYTKPTQTLYLAALTAHYQVRQTIIDLSGGRLLNCFPPPEIFPVVTSDNINPAKGEEAAIRLGIGQHSYDYSEEEVIAVVGRDTIPLNTLSQGSYFLPTHHQGEQEIIVELLVKNALTGEFSYQGKHWYRYFIR